MNEQAPDGIPIRFLHWTYHQVGFRALIQFILLLIVMSCLIDGLMNAVRGLSLGLLTAASVSGLLTGWLLARSKIKSWLAAVFAAVLGFGAIFVRIGQLSDEAADLILELNGLALEAMLWHPWKPAPDPAPLLENLSKLSHGGAVLLARVSGWLAALSKGESAYDPIAVLLVWGLAVWLVSTWASWAVRRQNQPLAGVLPAAVLLGSGLAYVRISPYTLLPFLAATFLLMALNSYSARELHWRDQAVDYSEDIRLDLGLVTVMLVIGLILLAALAPQVSVRDFMDWANRLGRPVTVVSVPVSDTLGFKPRPTGENEDAWLQRRKGGLPTNHLLGSGPEVSENVVMLVSTGDLPPGPPEALDHQAVPRYYWRSLTYDIYTGRGWVSSATENLSYAANEIILDHDRLILDGSESTDRFMTQKVQIVNQDMPGSGLVYASGRIVAVDQDYEVAWRSRPGPAETGTDADMFGAITHAADYQVISLLPKVGAAQLRSAGSIYPAWVLARYLALPEDLPPRVLELARNLTATEPNPYARAHAIEEYLRTYPYSLDLELPPSRVDVVDYFLFDLRQGFCDYYASAMVVLARAAGLPARLVVGYASGTYDAYTARYQVSEADAHAWPEIFFPGYGWIEFEPTAGRPAIARPDETLDDAIGAASEENHQNLRPHMDWPPVFASLGVLGAVVVLLAILRWLSETWRLGRLSPAAAAAVLYHKLQQSGVSLSVPVRTGDTPYEYLASFSGRITNLASGKLWRYYLPPAVEEAQKLIDLYARASYSAHPPDLDEQRKAIQTWRRLKRRISLARLRKVR